MRKNKLAHSGHRAFGAAILLFLTFAHSVYSQCAGADNTITVCDKYGDISNKTFDLFANLNGMPTPGGTWSTPNAADLNALDINTGIVNLWRINRFGEHEFTYTNDNCNQSATITLFLGGYAGEDNIDGSANACSDHPAVNLFSFLGSNVDEVIPDFNGVWEEDPNTVTGFLNGNLFNAESAGPGEYIFTYTVPDFDSCPGMQSTVNLEVHKAPNPGIPSNLIVCTTDDLSGLTNLDLNDLLTNEDPNGVWSEVGTNQLDNLQDHFVNVEAINANHGYGNYSFAYSVEPPHPVCPVKSSEVFIIILPTLNGSMEAENYCSGTEYEIILEYDASLLPSGQYELGFSVTSTQGEQDSLTEITLTNGTGNFIVPESLVPINELVQINILGIIGIVPERIVCNDINVPPTEFLVSTPIASTENICPNNPVDINLQNILDLMANPTNESHNVNFTLTLPDNSVVNLSKPDVVFTDGSASFNIEAEQFQLSGSYTLEITVEDSYEIGCTINTGIQVLPIPEEIDLEIAVDNNCDATSIDVLVDAPTLPDGSYTIDYEVIEQNTQSTLTDNTINFMGGVAVYGIDIANLPDGDYIVLLKSTQNDSTPCRLQFEFELQEGFSIGGEPIVVEAEEQQSFCLNEGTPTLEDITVSTSGAIAFYPTAESQEALPMATLLEDGEDYYVSSTDQNNNCVSEERTRVQVSFFMAEVPTTINSTPVYCASDEITLADLDIATPNGGTIVWYDADEGGTMLDPTDPVVDGQSYFAAEQLAGFCESDTRLTIKPTVVQPPLPDLISDELLVCALDNPTVAELENLENFIEAEVEWFNVAEGGTALPSYELLEDDTIYYAQSYDGDTGCINTNRVPVAVDLNNCDPEKYGFFIPDAFSPNNDGRNDTYYIPNIEIIFPHFTLEILNRYGNSLFKGDVSNPAWDGSGPGGKTVPNGVYFYIINFNKEGHAPKQGRLYLNQ
ncbi:T9SS type B sorting domain-containing protein [Muricauda sp. HICW]|uniref:T9SS type B sorting domain-containing protein n=1 Tax=Flagellimonas chongwuensis TaxID=2697365 RepID=A0A850NI02_9FLAO|nr:gliding motility-associated C-terminal domain-containing protein [Allomuricauda chongwuensis]NVN18045.1 T9SS type B sorting domain-containing protein [Allomuricauda chongwuensis]